MFYSTASGLTAPTVGILLLAGCTPTNDPADDGPSVEPVDGGTLTWAIAAEPTAGGVDPMVATSLAAQVINDVAYDTLLTKDDSGQLQPSLAASWEHPDELTWIFTLRDDIQFADGTPFTADDVVYTFETYQQATTSKRAYLAAVSGVEATGDHEVTFHFSEPDGTFLNAISGSSTFFIIGREGYGSATEQERQRNSYGTGAFQVTDWVDGASITMTANENASVDGEPRLDEIVFEVIPDETTRLAALQQGTAQAAYLLDGSLASQAEQSGFTVGDLAYTQNITVYLNPESGPLSDVRVRRAVSLSLDRKALVDTAMLGYGAVSFLPPSGDPEAPEIEDSTPYYSRDIDEAKRLLDEAGQTNPEITLSYMGDVAASQHPIYEMMQQQLAEAGITLTLQAKPLSEIAPVFTAGESFTGLLSIPGTPKADPLYYFDALLAESGSFNYWEGNPDADRARQLWIEARQTTDPAAYSEVIADLADEAAEQVLAIVPMAVPVYFEVWDAATLHDYASDPYYSRHRLTESWVSPN